MCNVAQNPYAGLAMFMLDALNGYGSNDNGESYGLQYQSGMAALERSQAAARQNAQNVMADSAARRENLQRAAALEGGKARAAYGASGLSLDRGSILDLIAEQAGQAQREAAQITEKATRDAAMHRQTEEYYGLKKDLLYSQYEQQRKNAAKSSLLFGGNNWRGGLLAFNGIF